MADDLMLVVWTSPPPPMFRQITIAGAPLATQRTDMRCRRAKRSGRHGTSLQEGNADALLSLLMVTMALDIALVRRTWGIAERTTCRAPLRR